MSQHFPLLLVVVPLFGAILVFFSSLTRRKIAWEINVAANFISFAIALYLLFSVQAGGRISYHLGGWAPPWGIEYVVDLFSGYVLVVISLVSLLIAIFSGMYVKKQIGPEREVNFHAIYLLLFVGLLGMVVTGDIFNLYVFLEISSLAGYSLVALGKKRGAIVASFNYLTLGTIGALFVLLGVGHLYMVTGTLNMADLQGLLPELYHSRVVRTGFVFLVIGFGLKFALFPLHTWLLSAHSLAPSAVSAILAAAVLKVNAYALMRFMYSVFTPDFVYQDVPIAEIFFVITPVAIITSSLMALAQTNIKRMLAYSSIGQIGYIVLGIALNNETALTGSLLHLFNHALMKGGLFLIAGIIIYQTDRYHITEWKGLGKTMPLTMITFTICGLSMIGVPLTVGFVSKWYLALGAIESGHWYFVLVIMASSLMTAMYFWRIIEWGYFHEPDDPADKKDRCHVPWTMMIPTMIIAFFILYFGIFGEATARLAYAVACLLLGGH
jgi:multicomponent Na+:H+ antiporter subunit D